MSFMRLPGEDPSTMLGGGDWANEYSYKNPTTGKWEYSRSPRTYGDNGDMTYEEWMKEKYGWEPGTYGASAADNAYNEWLKRVTPENKGRMNGMGEFIVGTKPNEATKSEASQLGESTAVSANEESLSTSEDKGTDYSWITSATEETMPEQESEYPNGMSEEEFNDYYTFAYGMTHGTPWNLDDKGERMPYYGDIELPSSLAEQAKSRLDNYTGRNESKRKALQEEYDKYNNYAKTLADFVEKYKDKYKGIDLEKETRKSQLDSEDTLKALENEYSEAEEGVFSKQQEYSKLLMDKGIDWTDYNEVLDEKASNFELSKEDKSRASKSAESIVKAISQRGFKGGEFALPVDKSAKEKGNYLISTWPITGAGVSKLGIMVIAPRGDIIAIGDVTTPNAWANGSWFLKDTETDKTIASGESTSAFAQSVTKALSNTAVADYENSKSTSSFPSDVVSAAKAVRDAENKRDELENKLDAERNEAVRARTSKSKDEQKEIMNAYASGKMNAVQAANALARAQESGILDFTVNSVMSDVPADKFKIEEPIGKVGETSVGKDSFVDDVSNPKTAEFIITKFEHLNEIKEELGKVDISTVTNEEEAKAANEKITALTKNAVEVANRDFVAIYKELVSSGIEAKDLASNPKVKQLSQEAFEVGQDIYERASELEAKTNELGLTNLDKKYIKKHLDEVSIKVGQLDSKNNKAVGSYYSPGSNMNGTNTSQPTGINLSKDEVKALADYANDIQSTKDAGLAIMKSAAFNGAENVTGGKYVEEWKNAKALETGNFKEGAQEFVKDKGKLTWKDYFAAGAKGTLGTAVAILGGAVTAVNPVLGILLMTVGTASATKAGLQITTDVVRSKSTNKEMMFGSNEGGKDVFRDIYNRSLESANFGDERSVGTYTNLGNGAISIVAGLVELIENPVLGVAAIKSGVEDINKAGNGGLSSNLDTAVKNIYDLGVDISTFLDRNDLKPEALGLTENLPTFIPNVKDKRIWNGDYTVYADTKNNATDPAAASEYGSAESSEELSEEEKAALDAAYSGAKEQAKNSNLATDYNAGMEQNVNEAVSDERVKGFIVKIYGSEPDYIRNAISKILAAHSEREW